MLPPSEVPPKAVLPWLVFKVGFAVITRHPDLSHGYFGKIPNAFASRFN